MLICGVVPWQGVLVCEIFETFCVLVNVLVIINRKFHQHTVKLKVIMDARDCFGFRRVKFYFIAFLSTIKARD